MAGLRSAVIHLKRCGFRVIVEFTQRVDTRGGDHAAITDHHQMVEFEGVFTDHGDDVGERGRIGGVAGEHPHRDRAAFTVSEQPEVDLLAAFFTVAGVPRAASSQWLPVIHVLDRSNNAIRLGFTCGPRCLAASFFSIASWRSTSQSIAA